MDESIRQELAKFGLNATMASLPAEETIFESPVSFIDSVAHTFLQIGYLSYAGKGCYFRDVSIGRYCSFAANALVGPGEHGTEWLSTHPLFEDWSRGRVSPEPHPRTTIGNDVWIGDGALIMAGVHISDGAVIGARSVVTRDVGPYEVVAGVPARVLRRRFPDALVIRLLKLGWWRYDLAVVKDRLDFSKTEQCVDAIERGLADGILRPLTPRRYRFVRAETQLIIGELPED